MHLLSSNHVQGPLPYSEGDKNNVLTFNNKDNLKQNKNKTKQMTWERDLTFRE